MKTSVAWLSRYVRIPWPAAELADRLTLAGLEVEGIERLGDLPETVVVAEILRRDPHPNADRLSVCSVNAGGPAPLQVVCGAPNCEAGSKVPCALVGAVLPNGLTVKQARLRGVDSAGMLCAEDELGLGESHAGLLVLPADSPVGVPVRDLMPADTVIDWEVTPNRPDWNSHVGIAREIAAVAGCPESFSLPAIPAPAGAGPDAAALTSVTVQDEDLCPRYIARVIQGVRIGPSPAWLQRALAAVGVRSINNVVDVTNFVMMECGQPLHAFDLATLAGRRIVVRRARPGEQIVTLDDVTRTLTDETLLICDAERPVALAGVMGGANTEIRESTTEVLLESACFAPASIRATSRRVGLSSESSYRFERGVDIAMTEWASRRAAALIAELGGGRVVPGAVDVYPQPYEPIAVALRYSRLDALLGVTVPPAVVQGFLAGLGLRIESATPTGLTARIPPHRRFDLLREVDLIEEVARLHGLDNIPGSRAMAVSGGSRADDTYYPIEEARQQLRALGLDETMTYSFANPDTALRGTGLAEANLVRLANPLSLDLSVMRPTLLHGILASAAHNIAHGNDDLAIFELGRVIAHHPDFPEERHQIAILMTGRRAPERFGDEKAAEVDFFDLKGVLEGWFAARRLSPTCQPAAHPAFRAGAAATWRLDGQDLAVFGQVGDDLTADMRLKHPLFVALIELDRVLSHSGRPMRHQALPAFPPVARDISFVAPASLTHGQVMDAIAAFREPLIESTEIFDIYEDAALGADRRSMAYTVIYRDRRQTLTDARVNQVHERLRSHLAAALGVALR